MGGSRLKNVLGLLGLSAATTGLGVFCAYQIEQVILPFRSQFVQFFVVGMVEEAFIRFFPLVGTFYIWSFVRGNLLTKTEGFVAAVTSGLVVAGLELVIKLRYLSQFEMAARIDALLLPILFVHLPFALIAGRFAYALGERIHGKETISRPTMSRRTLVVLLTGYFLLVISHTVYNNFV